MAQLAVVKEEPPPPRRCRSGSSGSARGGEEEGAPACLRFGQGRCKQSCGGGVWLYSCTSCSPRSRGDQPTRLADPLPIRQRDSRVFQTAEGATTPRVCVAVSRSPKGRWLPEAEPGCATKRGQRSGGRASRGSNWTPADRCCQARASKLLSGGTGPPGGTTFLPPPRAAAHTGGRGTSSTGPLPSGSGGQAVGLGRPWGTCRQAPVPPAAGLGAKPPSRIMS